MKLLKVKTENQNWVQTIIKWLPAMLVSIFFVQNAFEKILKSTELDKAGLSPTQILITGIVLLIATALYLIDKTMIIGTVILMLYMISVVFIHFNNGKSYIIASQIVLAIAYGAYMRRIDIIPKK